MGTERIAEKIVPTIRCPNCKQKLLHKSNGELLVRSKGPIRVNDDGTCSALCHFCKAAVDLPLELSKSARPNKRIRLVIGEGAD